MDATAATRKRLMLLASVTALAALAFPFAASGASRDIQRLDLVGRGGSYLAFAFDDGDKLLIRGEVECRVEDTWGIVMKAFGPVQSGSEDFQPFGDDEAGFTNEALGFGGPGSGNRGPVEQPCSETVTDFDLVLEKLGSSDDFEDDELLGLWAVAAESPTQQADPAFLGDAEVFFGEVLVEQRN